MSETREPQYVQREVFNYTITDLFYDDNMKRNSNGQFIKRTDGELYEGFAVFHDNKGYPCICIDNKTIRLHVFIWERVYGEKPEGYEIHHIDFDKKNFRIENLELLSISDHCKIHAGWIRQDNQWIAKPCNRCGRVLSFESFYPRKGYTPSALCKPCHNKTIRERINAFTPEAKAKLAEYKREWERKKKHVGN